MQISNEKDQDKQMFILKPSQNSPQGWMFTLNGKVYVSPEQIIILDIPNKSVVDIIGMLNMNEIESLHLQDTTQI